MKRSLRLISVVLVCLSLGLHWAALQSVAWTTMVIERTCSGSFGDALVTTFDGQHPCKLCQVVQAGQTADDTAGALVHGLKLEGFAAVSLVIPGEPPGGQDLGGTFLRVPAERSQPPPLPPPRLA
ncbi:MAG: hypothetical protein J0L84_08040 [Verrucomicrobia bacterium]|nr:hypothetical protein [Verrucomicrobiota bacterium]